MTVIVAPRRVDLLDKDPQPGQALLCPVFIIVNFEMLMLLPDSPPTQPDLSDREEARLNARYPLLLSGQSDPGNYPLIRVGHRRNGTRALESQ